MTIMTHTDTIRTWRDLADQLTDNQYFSLTRFEQDAAGVPTEVAACLMEMAQDHIRQNKVDREQFGHIAAPAGALKLYHWEQDDEGQWFRDFTGTSRAIEIPGSNHPLHVDIAGKQFADGTVTRSIAVYTESAEITAALARKVAAVLTDAAAELERLQ